MTLRTMYVLGHTVKVQGAKGLELPYQFNGVETIKFNKDDDDTQKASYYKASDVFIVDITMPLGGSQSALFRYPKEGEKVLIGNEGSWNFLMGYFPGDSPGFTENDIQTYHNLIAVADAQKKAAEENGEEWEIDPEHKAEIDRLYDLFQGGPMDMCSGMAGEMVLPEIMAGEFFRYKGQGDPQDKFAFSEIGFYTEPDINSDNFLDVLRTQSTGDMHQTAANHNQIKAARYELLVNAEASRYTDWDSPRSNAYGDATGDDPILHEGDAHIRVKGDLVIKAGKPIVLQTGRSKVIIDDRGINIFSKKVRANMQSGWDSMVSVNSLNGVNVYGTHLNLRSGMGFELTDMFGGKMESKAGIARIEGIDVKASTISNKLYGIRLGVNLLDFLLNGIPTGLGAGGIGVKNSKYISLTSTLLQTFTSKLAGKAVSLIAGPSNLATYDYKGIAGLLIQCMDYLYLVLKIVEIAMEEGLAPLLKWNEEGNIGRDIFHATIAYIENGYLLATATAIFTANLKGLLHESVVHLAGDGSLTFNAFNARYLNIRKDDDKAVVAGLSDKIAAADAEMEEMDQENEDLKARREEVIAKFKPENWNNLTNEERQDILNEVAGLVAEETGLTTTPPIRIADAIDLVDTPEETWYGWYDPETGEIVINGGLIGKNGEKVLTTITHELWHARQYEIIKDPTNPWTPLYLYNHANFILNPQDAYEKQLLEAEAHNYGYIWRDRFQRQMGRL